MVWNEENTLSNRERSLKLRRLVGLIDTPVDVLTCNTQELQKALEEPNSFTSQIVKEGELFMLDSIDAVKWKQRAMQDLCTIENNLKDDPEFLASLNCYLAQQAVEKLLKAYLLTKQQTLPKTHDLLFLLKKCSELNGDFLKLQSSVEILNIYAIEARYSGDFFDDIKVVQAKEAYEAALMVKEFVNQS